MQKKLITPKKMPPLTISANGYDYYTKTSEHGLIYCRRAKSQGSPTTEVGSRIISPFSACPFYLFILCLKHLGYFRIDCVFNKILAKCVGNTVRCRLPAFDKHQYPQGVTLS